MQTSRKSIGAKVSRAAVPTAFLSTVAVFQAYPPQGTIVPYVLYGVALPVLWVSALVLTDWVRAAVSQAFDDLHPQGRVLTCGSTVFLMALYFMWVYSMAPVRPVILVAGSGVGVTAGPMKIELPRRADAPEYAPATGGADGGSGGTGITPGIPAPRPTGTPVLVSQDATQKRKPPRPSRTRVTQ